MYFFKKYYLKDTNADNTTQTAEIAVASSYITEGLSEILSEGRVFYNPVQQFNRDLSIAVIATYSKIYRQELLQSKKPSNDIDEPLKELNVNEVDEVCKVLHTYIICSRCSLFMYLLEWIDYSRSVFRYWVAKHSLCKRNTGNKTNYRK